MTRATPTSRLRLLTTNAAIRFVRVFGGRIDIGSFEVAADANADTYSNGRAHSDSYTYSDAETFTDGETGVNAEAASDAATAPVALTFVAVSAVRHDSRSGPRLCQEAQHH